MVIECTTRRVGPSYSNRECALQIFFRARSVRASSSERVEQLTHAGKIVLSSAAWIAEDLSHKLRLLAKCGRSKIIKFFYRFGWKCNLAGHQEVDKRPYVWEVHFTVLVAISLFEKAAPYQNFNKRSNILEGHFSVLIDIPQHGREA